MVKIVVFDSGFGSLSVIKPIQKKIKSEIIYFADQKNYPYGFKKKAELREIIKNSIVLLDKKFKPDLIVINYIYNDIILRNSEHITLPLEIKKNIYKPKILTFKIISYLKNRIPTNVSSMYSNQSEWIEAYYQKYLSNESRGVYIKYINEIETIKQENNKTNKEKIKINLHYVAIKQCNFNFRYYCS